MSATIPDRVRFHTAARNLATGEVTLANGPSDTGWLDADLAVRETASYSAGEAQECEADHREPKEEFFTVTAVTAYTLGADPSEVVFDVEHRRYDNQPWTILARGCATADLAWAIVDDLAPTASYAGHSWQVVESRRTLVERPALVKVS